ncbi:hypothetical protein F8388_014862, partial [Cannabis sativa]
MYHKNIGHPCLHCHPQSYIRMVQHLIERFWRELQKENREFFHAYYHSISPKPLT